MRLRPARVVPLLALAALLVPGTAAASPIAPTDPDLQWEDRAVTSLQPNVTTLERSIEPLEDVATDGDETAITLQADVLFAFGSSELSVPARAKVAELAAEIPDGAEVAIGGHTDDIPYQRGNDVLSTERAQAVADAIADARPDLELEVTGYGDSRPVASNSSGGEDDPEGRAQNRRVEIRYAG